MTTDITIFDFDEMHPVRVLMRDGEPWFVLNDVCRIVGINNISMAAARLDQEDVDDISETDVTGRSQKMTVISEAGLYDLVLRSNKPQAKPFRKWVTGTVLPSIRRTGAYVAPNATMQGVAAAATMSGNLEVARDLLNILGDWCPNLGGNARQAVASSLMAQCGVSIPAPVVDQSWQMSEIAEQYGMSPIAAGKLCAHLKSDEHGDLVYTTAAHTNKIVEQFRWNARGREACEAVLRRKLGGMSSH